MINEEIQEAILAVTELNEIIGDQTFKTFGENTLYFEVSVFLL